MRRGAAVANGAQQQQRSRSRPQSRVRLNRANFNGNNNRNGNNQASLRRSNSQARNPQMRRSNSQARNQAPARRANSQARNQAPARRANSQAQLRRTNSVNSRLVNNGQSQIRRGRRFASNTRNQKAQLKKPLGGRIAKRNPRNPVGTRIQNNLRQTGNGRNARNALVANPRRGKTVKRWIQIS